MKVVLISKPQLYMDGSSLTIGKVYHVNYQYGCCYNITTDVDDEVVHLNTQRTRPATPEEIAQGYGTVAA